jgi:hypothetical protein
MPLNFRLVNKQLIHSQKHKTVVAHDHKRSAPISKENEAPAKTVRPEIRVFGKPTRPSTPIADVVKNKFGLIGEKEHLLRVKEVVENKKVARGQLRVEVKPTKASEAHAKRVVVSSEPAPVKEPFKMSKFKKIKAKVVQPK